VDNTLLAAEAALALDELELGPEEIARAMAHLSPVPGRLQVIAAPGSTTGTDGPPFTVLVDYAHTPAGLEVVLGEARGLVPSGRVLCVFGCGGNRDRAKRPLMGAAATQLSDLAFLTSDNPRFEDPRAILEDVLGGVPGERSNPHIVVEPDRRVAIRLALHAARSGDVVVIAGKGHETYQEVAGERLPFDDAVEARRILSSRFSADPRTWAAQPGVGVGVAVAGAASSSSVAASPVAARGESASRQSLPEA
jgi:UDP-N-acetylmuramoyl-L-alanyl-D-glutamate--2,6-diaminopimelate ligase